MNTVKTDLTTDSMFEPGDIFLLNDSQREKPYILVKLPMGIKGRHCLVCLETGKVVYDKTGGFIFENATKAVVDEFLDGFSYKTYRECSISITQ